MDYVARLLNEYYPNTDAPAALTDLNQKAAAVQAAIWFFTDRYVLNTSDPLHDTVAAIVDHIIDAGPLPEQPPPSLTITPSQLSGPAGSVLGPFTVNTNTGAAGAPAATVTATGGRYVLGLGTARCRSPMEPRCRPARRSGCAPRVPPPWCSRPPRRQPSPPATSTSTTATPAGSATPST